MRDDRSRGKTASIVPSTVSSAARVHLSSWAPIDARQQRVKGLDIAKSVFQVHGVDAQGSVAVRRQIKRRYVVAFFKKLPSCLVGIEACATSHHWSRELQALGHTVRLIPPAYVKPYVKRQKNDAADAEAICEAVQRPNMRFVPTKTPEQQRMRTATSSRICRIPSGAYPETTGATEYGRSPHNHSLHARTIGWLPR